MVGKYRDFQDVPQTGMITKNILRAVKNIHLKVQ